MAEIKDIRSGLTQTGMTSYIMALQFATGKLLDDDDGDFDAAASDPHVTLAEHATIKGMYYIAESRQVWADGIYYIFFYKQIGGSPAPVSDVMFGQGEIYIINDTEVNEREYLNAIRNRVQENAFQDGSVWINTVTGSSGTTDPLGTALNPVDNWADAKAIAATNLIDKFDVSGSIVIGASDDITGKIFKAGADHATIVLTSGCTTLNTEFRGHIHISGTFGGHVHCFGAHFLTGTYLLEGFFDNCLFDDGNYSIAANALTRFTLCRSSGQQGQAVVFSCAGANLDLGIWGWSGKMEIEDKDNGATFDIEMATGELEVASSCTGGQIRPRGWCEVTDNSGPGCTVNTGKEITVRTNNLLASLHGSGTWDVAAVITGLTQIKGAGWVAENLTTIDALVDAIKAKTDNLPADPASSTNVADHDTSIDSQLATIDSNVDAVKVKTDNLPADTDTVLTSITGDVTTLKKIATGRWIITGNQMIFYDTDGLTPIYTFDLKDGAGLATEVNPKERVPV